MSETQNLSDKQQQQQQERSNNQNTDVVNKSNHDDNNEALGNVSYGTTTSTAVAGANGGIASAVTGSNRRVVKNATNKNNNNNNNNNDPEFNPNNDDHQQLPHNMRKDNNNNHNNNQRAPGGNARNNRNNPSSSIPQPVHYYRRAIRSMPVAGGGGGRSRHFNYRNQQSHRSQSYNIGSASFIERQNHQNHNNNNNNQQKGLHPPSRESHHHHHYHHHQQQESSSSYYYLSDAVPLYKYPAEVSTVRAAIESSTTLENSLRFHNESLVDNIHRSLIRLENSTAPEPTGTHHNLIIKNHANGNFVIIQPWNNIQQYAPHPMHLLVHPNINNAAVLKHIRQVLRNENVNSGSIVAAGGGTKSSGMTNKGGGSKITDEISSSKMISPFIIQSAIASNGAQNNNNMNNNNINSNGNPLHAPSSFASPFSPGSALPKTQQGINTKTGELPTALSNLQHHGNNIDQRNALGSVGLMNVVGNHQRLDENTLKKHEEQQLQKRSAGKLMTLVAGGGGDQQRSNKDVLLSTVHDDVANKSASPPSALEITSMGVAQQQTVDEKNNEMLIVAQDAAEAAPLTMKTADEDKSDPTVGMFVVPNPSDLGKATIQTLDTNLNSFNISHRPQQNDDQQKENNNDNNNNKTHHQQEDPRNVAEIDYDFIYPPRPLLAHTFGTLPEAVAAQLRQCPALRLVPTQTYKPVLRLGRGAYGETWLVEARPHLKDQQKLQTQHNDELKRFKAAKDRLIKFRRNLLKKIDLENLPQSTLTVSSSQQLKRPNDEAPNHQSSPAPGSLSGNNVSNNNNNNNNAFNSATEKNATQQSNSTGSHQDAKSNGRSNNTGTTSATSVATNTNNNNNLGSYAARIFQLETSASIQSKNQQLQNQALNQILAAKEAAAAASAGLAVAEDGGGGSATPSTLPSGAAANSASVINNAFSPVQISNLASTGAIRLKNGYEIPAQQAFVCKVINRESSTFSQVANEVNILANVAHPNITAFIEGYVETGKMNLVMEYVDGGDLRKEIDDRRTVAPGQTMKRYTPESYIMTLFSQTCLGIEYLHRHNILHRDLKPENLIVSKKWLVKIADFGLAKRYENDISIPVGTSFVGTPGYVASEVWLKKGFSEKADVFSLGCILYELITLERAFPSHGMAKRDELPEGLETLERRPITRMEISRDVKELCDWLLEPDPDNRPSMLELMRVPVVFNSAKDFVRNFLKCAGHDPVDRRWGEILEEQLNEIKLSNCTSTREMRVEKRSVAANRIMSARTSYMNTRSQQMSRAGYNNSRGGGALPDGDTVDERKKHKSHDNKRNKNNNDNDNDDDETRQEDHRHHHHHHHHRHGAEGLAHKNQHNTEGSDDGENNQNQPQTQNGEYQ